MVSQTRQKSYVFFLNHIVYTDVLNLTNGLKGAPDMKKDNESKALTQEELDLVTGGGSENPTADDLSDRQGTPGKNNDHELPGGHVIS